MCHNMEKYVDHHKEKQIYEKRTLDGPSVLEEHQL